MSNYTTKIQGFNCQKVDISGKFWKQISIIIIILKNFECHLVSSAILLTLRNRLCWTVNQHSQCSVFVNDHHMGYKWLRRQGHKGFQASCSCEQNIQREHVSQEKFFSFELVVEFEIQ